MFFIIDVILRELDSVNQHSKYLLQYLASLQIILLSQSFVSSKQSQNNQAYKSDAIKKALNVIISDSAFADEAREFAQSVLNATCSILE